MNRINRLQIHDHPPGRRRCFLLRKHGAGFRLFKCFLILSLAFSIGLHWTLLQTVAWTGMIINFSRNVSFSEALNKTFDGQHPCCMCKAIKQAQAEEKEQQKQQVKPGSKMDWGLICQSLQFHFFPDREHFFSLVADAPPRSYEPPKPRPRTA
jgi:hypothetical protein